MDLNTTGIDHINMEVRDLQESVEFYHQLFGFELREDQSDQSSKIIGNDRIKLCLYKNPNLDASHRQGIVHFGFHVDNFDEIPAICEKLGVKVLYGGALKWSHSESIYIQDPNGYEIELSKVFGGGI